VSVHLMILLLTAGLAAAALLGTWVVIARMRNRHQRADDGAELPGAVLSTEDKAVVDEAEAYVYRYWRRRYADPEHREK
jgi:hypothetical protein